MTELEQQTVCETCPDSLITSTAFPAVHDVLKDPADAPLDAEAKYSHDTKVKLLTIRKNLGHPSTAVMTKILQEAKAPKVIVDLVPQISCEVCDRMKRIRPARPVKQHHSSQLGETLGLDLSLYKEPNTNRRALLLHMIDEASKFHVVKVIKEDDLEERKSLGNINVSELTKALKDCWFRFFQSPKNIHCDSEGVFNSQTFLSWVGQKGIRVITTAGEAHWQLGTVERHIATLTDTAQKLSLDRPIDTPIQDIIDDACEATNSVGKYAGYSPAQWHIGRNHPLTQSQSVPPAYKEDEFLQHVHRRTTAQQHCIEAEARTIVRFASLARARTVFDVQPGDIVYYYRRGRKAGRKNTGRFLGPSKVLAVEKPESPGQAAPTIVWLGHGIQLIRAAPEHLRRATPLEISLSDFVNDSLLP